MIIMVSGCPVWCCSVCGFPLPQTGGLVRYGAQGMKGHFPAVHVLCGLSCAIVCEDKLTTPVRDMAWSAFVQALTQA